jgi:multidrug resistance efflux pump
MKVRFVEPERSDPDRDRGIKVPYAPGKRNLARWRWYLILLVVSSPLIYYIANMAWSSVLVEAPAIVSQAQITVRANSQGYVDEVYVKPMDTVAAGAPLLRLRNPDMSGRLDQMRAELKALEGVRSSGGSAPVSTVNLEAQLGIANQDRDQRSQRLGMVEQLNEQGAATDAELASARSDLQQADARVSQIHQEMTMLNKPPDASNGQQMQARVLSLRAEIAGLEKQGESLLVLAPSAGRVVDLTLVKGDQLAIGSKVAMLAPDNGELRIDAYVPPKYVQYARNGLHATVVFPDGTRRPAQVTDVPEVAQEIPSAHPEMFGNRDVGVLVRMKFLDSSFGKTALTNGLPVKVRFETKWNSKLPERVVATLNNWRS